MTKQNEAEAGIRSAAATLADAIAKGRDQGLAVAWPSRPEGLAAIAISATGKAKLDVTVQAGDVPADVAAKATTAARKAADRVLDKAAGETA